MLLVFAVLLCVCHFHSYLLFSFFFFNDTATTEIYTLSLHDALPIWPWNSQPSTRVAVVSPLRGPTARRGPGCPRGSGPPGPGASRSRRRRRVRTTLDAARSDPARRGTRTRGPSGSWRRRPRRRHAGRSGRASAGRAAP